MTCETRDVEIRAAAEILTIAERELQRIKHRGYSATKQNRDILRLPDLKALAYPEHTNVPVEVSVSTSDKFSGTSASGFTPPFADSARSDDDNAIPANYAQLTNAASKGSHAIPGLEFAGSGDISQLNKVTFNDPPVLYKQIAASILGEAPCNAEAAPSPPVFIGEETPEESSGLASQPNLYGAGPAATGGGSFPALCLASVRGAFYDWLHFEDATKAYSSRNGDAASWLTIASRDGRGPYLLFALVLASLVLLVVIALLRSLTATPPAMHLMPSVYPYTYASPPSIPPMSLAPLFGLHSQTSQAALPLQRA